MLVRKPVVLLDRQRGSGQFPRADGQRRAANLVGERAACSPVLLSNQALCLGQDVATEEFKEFCSEGRIAAGVREPGLIVEHFGHGSSLAATHRDHDLTTAPRPRQASSRNGLNPARSLLKGQASRRRFLVCTA